MIEKIQQLPLTHRATIPESYLDEMGHMNIQYYIHLYDRAAWGMFALFGVTFEDIKETQLGMFALKQFIQYLAEVHVGETVAIHSRILGVSAKRLHFIHFMVNETTSTLASTFEVLASQADLRIRRTAPFPDAVRAQIETYVNQHSALDWEAPLCGVLAP